MLGLSNLDRIQMGMIQTQNGIFHRLGSYHTLLCSCHQNIQLNKLQNRNKYNCLLSMNGLISWPNYWQYHWDILVHYSVHDMRS